MAESTSITPQIPKEAEQAPSSPMDTDGESINETIRTTSSISIEIATNDNEDLATSSLQASIETPNRTNPCDDDLESSPRALQNLVFAAASDLLEVSPRSSLDTETPTSQAGTPYAKRHQDEKEKSATTSTASEQSKTAKSKPKGILRKKLRYTSSVPIVIDSTSDLSPTTGNTIHNTNQYRKNRGNNDFDFDFLDIDRLVDKDDEEFYNSEHAGSTTLLSILWSVVVMPVVLLGYGGLPYLVLASLVWTLIFVARWFRRFLVEEFSMRRNHGSVKETTQKMPIPTAVEAASSSTRNSHTNLSGILSAISPVAGARKTKVRFPQGIKFPERKLLRQPIPRIQKPNKQKTNVRTSNKKPFFGAEENCDGDTWSLDSLMVLRNYMKDSDYNSGNSHNGLDPTPLSVMGLSPSFPPTQATTTMAPFENEQGSGDEADDECTDAASSLEEDSSENDEVPELMAALARRRDSLMLHPQEFIQEEDSNYESRYGHSCTLQLDEDMDDEPIDDYFQEGLFGKSDSSSPTAISDSKLRKKASRYRRRKPRDSLCFTFGKKSVIPECPAIPRCPSDELEFLEQKKQEKFEQAVVIEHFQQTEDAPVSLPSEESISSDDEIEDMDATSRNDLLEEIMAEGSDGSSSSMTSGSWDENEATSVPREFSKINESHIDEEDDENYLLSVIDSAQDMPGPVASSDFDDKVQTVLKDVEDLLAAHSKIKKSSSYHILEDNTNMSNGNDHEPTQIIVKEENDMPPSDNLQETVINDDSDYSAIIDEATQKRVSKEMPIVEEPMSTNDDDFPGFNVMQVISFDESDEVECILSSNAFEFDEEETMFRDRDPMIHVPNSNFKIPAFKKRPVKNRNDPIVREVLERSSDLKLDISVTEDDIDCMMSPIQTAETEMSTFDENDDSDVGYLASTPLESPENKENLNKKIPLGVKREKLCVNTTSATDKAFDELNSPWSPTFPRAALSPTN